MKHIDEARPGFLGGGFQGGGVEFQVFVLGLPVGQIEIARVFKGDGRDQHHARIVFAVVFLSLGLFDQTGHVLAKLLNALFPREGFVEPKKIQHHRGPAVREVRIGIAEVLRTNPLEGFIAGKTKIANDEFLLGKLFVKQRFPSVLMLHPLAERISHQANMIALFQLKSGGLGKRRDEHYGKGDE